MEQEITAVLQPLIGLPLFRAGRAHGLEWFQFGREYRIEGSHKGQREKIIGDYAIHIECAWRIVGREGIIVAWNDRYFSPNNSTVVEEDFDWSQPGSNRCDYLIEAFFAQRADRLPVVQAAQGDAVGGFRMIFSEGSILEVFPDTSLDHEHWRLLQPGTGEKHFVVVGKNVIIE